MTIYLNINQVVFLQCHFQQQQITILMGRIVQSSKSLLYEHKIMAYQRPAKVHGHRLLSSVIKIKEEP